MPSISIIIPCYNEEANLKRGVLDQVNSYLQKQKYQWEVLICNDHSTDNSLSMVNSFASKHPGFKVLDLPKGGKPGAIWGGVQAAKHPIVIFIDMDQSTPISEIAKLLPYFDEKYEMVIGSRGSHRQGNSFFRKLGSKTFLFVRRLVLLPSVVDTQCGFKAMTTLAAKKVFPHLQFLKDQGNKSGWRVSSYDVELLFIAHKLGYKIKEVPVNWCNTDTSTTKGDANTRYKKESIRMAQEVLRVKLNDIRGAYDQIK